MELFSVSSSEVVELSHEFREEALVAPVCPLCKVDLISLRSTFGFSYSSSKVVEVFSNASSEVVELSHEFAEAPVVFAPFLPFLALSEDKLAPLQ